MFVCVCVFYNESSYIKRIMFILIYFSLVVTKADFSFNSPLKSVALDLPLLSNVWSVSCTSKQLVVLAGFEPMTDQQWTDCKPDRFTTSLQCSGKEISD